MAGIIVSDSVPAMTAVKARQRDQQQERVVDKDRISTVQPLDLAFVFPGAKHAKPLSNMALLMLLRGMERADLTAHGFRSTFRDWAAEATGYAREVAVAT